jgi:hypothetical protein
MTKHHTPLARPLRALAALAAAMAIVAATSLAVAAAPASAAMMRCNGDNGRSFNACLSFDYLDYLWWDAHVGIDVYMPEQYGREIIACGADFKASLRGDDGKGANDPVIRELSIVPGWPIADSTGIAAELIGPSLYNDKLDEDDDSEDELYARVSFYDCHTGWTRNFTTGTIRANF